MDTNTKTWSKSMPIAKSVSLFDRFYKSGSKLRNSGKASGRSLNMFNMFVKARDFASRLQGLGSLVRPI